MITINELLYNRWISQNSRIKFVRHVNANYSVDEVYRNEKEIFLNYQSEQWKPIFHNCEYIVSFIGEGAKRSRFIGVFKVLSHKLGKNGNYYYKIEEESWFEDLKDRVVVDWVSLPRSWHQWMNDKNPKPIIEILPEGMFSRKTFTDYLDFVLDFHELKDVILFPDAYKDWHKMLSAVKWIYLILDKKNWNKYIGSAYNEWNWILGRWREYVKTNGHWNNKKLMQLIELDPSYWNNFQFTLLMTLPMTMTKNEVIKREQLYKNKLGTRIFWLNEN